MSVRSRSMKQVCNTHGLLFPERMAQNLLSLCQQTVHSSNVLCTNKHILGTRFSALKHSWPSQPGLSKIIQQPKTPRGGEMNLGLCVFKTSSHHLKPCCFSSPDLPLAASFLVIPPPSYLKTNWQAGVWTMFWGPKQSPTPLRGQTWIVATLDPSFLALCGSTYPL